MSESLERVEIKRLLRLRHAGGGVLLEAASKSFLIFIGPVEMRALVLAATGEQPPRPLSHNLLDRLLRHCRIEVRSVVIDALVDDTFHAKLTLRQGSREVEIDCRPSDALVLATLHGAEIFVARTVLDQVEDGEEMIAAMRRRLEAIGRRSAGEPGEAGRSAQEISAAAASTSPASSPEGPLGDVREVSGIDWSFLDELERRGEADA